VSCWNELRGGSRQVVFDSRPAVPTRAFSTGFAVPSTAVASAAELTARWASPSLRSDSGRESVYEAVRCCALTATPRRLRLCRDRRRVCRTPPAASRTIAYELSPRRRPGSLAAGLLFGDVYANGAHLALSDLRCCPVNVTSWLARCSQCQIPQASSLCSALLDADVELFAVHVDRFIVDTAWSLR
jgi:hypothetical protein